MRSTGIMVLCAVVFLGACGGEETPSTPPGTPTVDPSDTEGDHSLPGDPVAGAEVYGRICVACHAADGRGNGGLTGANFIDDETRLAKNNDRLLTSIRDGVTTGPTPMPGHRDLLTDVEMRNALSYIRHEFGGTQEGDDGEGDDGDDDDE